MNSTERIFVVLLLLVIILSSYVGCQVGKTLHDPCSADTVIQVDTVLLPGDTVVHFEKVSSTHYVWQYKDSSHQAVASGTIVSPCPPDSLFIDSIFLVDRCTVPVPAQYPDAGSRISLTVDASPGSLQLGALLPFNNHLQVGGAYDIIRRVPVIKINVPLFVSKKKFLH